MLVGDGVNTNENAAKRVLQHMLGEGAMDRMDYRLLVWKCSSHQANLCVAAAIAGEHMTNALDKCELCATLSRLYKYLIPSYLDEFTGKLRDFVAQSFVMRNDMDSPETLAHQRRTEGLANLYGPQVLPPDLLNLLNRDLQQLEHVAPDSAGEGQVRQKLFDELRRLVLLVEEKPVVTRFFLFAPCCWALCRMKLLGLPADIFSVGKVSPSSDSKTRLQAVRTFYSCPSSQSRIRRAALCLRLTAFATSITAQTTSGNGSSAVPPLVRLGKGEVQVRTAGLIAEILLLLEHDPSLDKKDVVHHLLLTEASLIIRFDMYRRYPTSLWKLTRAYNPDYFSADILQFLHEDEKVLDGGYSLPLQQAAWAAGQGTEAGAAAYLMSDPVQDEIAAIFRTGSASSLDIERKHKQDKQGETTKVTSVASASRNSILSRYAIGRQKRLERRRWAAKQETAAKHFNVRAAAISRNPGLFQRGRGKLLWESNISPEERRSVTHDGDEQALKRYIEENRGDLEREVQARRDRAKFCELQASGLPTTIRDWVGYLQEHDAQFRELLRTATEQRKTTSQCLSPMAGVEGAVRVYPQPQAEAGHSPHWCHLKPGFYCFKSPGGVRLVCFVASIAYTVYAATLCPGVGSRDFSLLTVPLLSETLRPIREVLTEALIPDGPETSVYILGWELVSTGANRVSIRIDEAEKVPTPAAVPVKRGKSAGSNDAPPPGDLEPEFNMWLESFDRMDSRESDCGSACASGESEASDSAADSGSSPAGEESASEDESQEEGLKHRKPAGTNVVYRNTYFRFTDDPNYRDVKVTIAKQWCRPGLLGTTNMSKTVVPSHFGDTRASPVRSSMVLKAWMLHRAAQNGFDKAKSARRRLFEKEAELLRAAIEAVSSPHAPTTGHSESDARVRLWAPEMLAPS